MTGTHYDRPDGHQYSSLADQHLHLSPGEVDDNGNCYHASPACADCDPPAGQRFQPLPEPDWQSLMKETPF